MASSTDTLLRAAALGVALYVAFIKKPTGAGGGNGGGTSEFVVGQALAMTGAPGSLTPGSECMLITQVTFDTITGEAVYRYSLGGVDQGIVPQGYLDDYRSLSGGTISLC